MTNCQTAPPANPPASGRTAERVPIAGGQGLFILIKLMELRRSRAQSLGVARGLVPPLPSVSQRPLGATILGLGRKRG